MLQATSNRTNYPVESLLGVASRENNRKRGYLLVNRLQGKHVPVSPAEALALFAGLGKLVAEELAGEQVAFVGFAETATAIGAQVAAVFPGESWYLQTTRETVDPRFAVVDFQEEHSHATQQRLFCADRSALTDAGRIVFVEDELTTGRTILNFVDALEQRGIGGRFAVASLVNSMEAERLERFARRGIGVYYLVGLRNNFGALPLTDRAMEEQKPSARQAPPAEMWPVGGYRTPREGGCTRQYRAACAALAERVKERHGHGSGRRMLVLGTEECMYPALVCGAALEGLGWEVRTHATTRSPILVGGKGNPLRSRVSLDSLYEEGRPTYLYNLDRYDQVLVVTDAQPINGRGLAELLAALDQHGNERIQVIHWVK